jgi:filamentous hemagglutinin family protein
MKKQPTEKWIRHPVLSFSLVALWLVLVGGRASANPQGMTVVSGSAHSTQQAGTLQITTSQNAFLQWSSFNIAGGETTVFEQPSANSIVFNNIKNANPTTIFGSLQANGIVVLENQSGFYFGPNAFVQAGGLVVTTAAINPWASAAGAGWSFDGPPAAAPIVNYGHLQTASGGSLFLIAKQIDNQGTIQAPGGMAALVAGQQVLLSDRPNGLGLSAPVQLPAGSVDNQGRIVADAGQVLLQAQTVNNSGVIQANSVREKNGVIELYASDEVQLAGTSVIQANGDAEGTSPGGNIVIKSGGAFSDSAGSQITATGGANGGNGGNVEVSAPNILSLNSTLNAGAAAGWLAGELLLDPTSITLGGSGAGSAGGGTVNYNSGPDALALDVNTAFQNFSQILLQATGDITLSPNTAWDLSQSTRQTAGQLTLEAGGDITVGSSSLASEITDANNWSVTLEAGFNFATGQVTSGSGSVNLVGNSAIQTAAGNINVLAGKAVTVGTGGIVTGIANGALMTGAGGNIVVQALSGDVNCGTSTYGYDFVKTGVGYSVDPNLGGISTASGGNVSILAGGSIVAEMPFAGSDIVSDAGSGAFGAAPGNVTLTAGKNVTGHYVLANGAGSITAGNDAGTSSLNLALSLIKGGWVVDATENIVLSEVRNPNGAFNSLTAPNPFLFHFNYDPMASVLLDAGNNVTITGNSLPRASGDGGEGGEDLVFPPILTIAAGAGGITIENSLSLFPSPEGTLNLFTTGGGNLSGSVGATGVSLCISDSQSLAWTGPSSFTVNDPGNDVLHLADPNPVLINISGSVSDINLSSPKPVQMHVTGNITDSSAMIENLRPTDNSVISAGGEIFDEPDYVFITLPPGETPNFNALDQAAQPILVGSNPNGSTPTYVNPPLYGVQAKFIYNPATRVLAYLGIMTDPVEAALLSMQSPFVDAATIQQIYAQSQNESSSPLLGYDIAGPGAFHISAASIDLGDSKGVDSQGIDLHPALVPYTARGADIDITVSGNLSMLASAIESEYGGDINITCGGTLDVGSTLVPSSSLSYPLGIVSLWGGNINLVANGDVNVDGSRIAAYDGGDIFVESLDGNVNAGTGGAGTVLVSKPYVNKLGKVVDLYDAIPGSGIIATSYPNLVYGESASHLGNITVETPEGDIVASRGGIKQLALGPTANQDVSINLTAGSRNSDGTVAYVGDVDAAGSGVVGGQVNITATGDINGLVVASLGANVNAAQNVNATVLSQGAANVTGGGTVAGMVVGVGLVSVSGAKGDTALALSDTGVAASGAASGAAIPAAPTSSNSNSGAGTQNQVTQSTQPNSELASNDDDDLKKKQAQNSKLKEYVGRVTVILPE